MAIAAKSGHFVAMQLISAQQSSGHAVLTTAVRHSALFPQIHGLHLSATPSEALSMQANTAGSSAAAMPIVNDTTSGSLTTPLSSVTHNAKLQEPAPSVTVGFLTSSGFGPERPPASGFLFALNHW